MTDKTITLTAPTFTLEAPAPVQEVPLESVSGAVKLKPEEVIGLDKQVTDFINDITSSNPQDTTFKNAVERIHQMGNIEVERASQVSNRMLERPLKTLNQGEISQSKKIGDALLELRRTVDSLNPKTAGSLTPKKFLGFIPFGNKLVDYFERYQSSQAHLNAIIETLKVGKDELIKDNIALEQEKQTLWDLMNRLEKYIFIGQKLDAKLEQKVIEFEATDAEKAKIVRDEMLFYTRQKVVDLLTQQSVNIQGYLSFDVLRKTNLELIKGVDRATTTTVSALRVAVTVAQALANQKLVLDQITALNQTTGSLIQATSEMLRDQSATIHQQASSSTIDLGQLQSAFDNIYATLDGLDRFKQEALVSMKGTVETLSHSVEKAKSYADKVRQNDLNRLKDELNQSSVVSEVKL